MNIELYIDLFMSQIALFGTVYILGYFVSLALGCLDKI